jgi:hypothetical protein
MGITAQEIKHIQTAAKNAYKQAKSAKQRKSRYDKNTSDGYYNDYIKLYVKAHAKAYLSDDDLKDFNTYNDAIFKTRVQISEEKESEFTDIISEAMENASLIYKIGVEVCENPGLPQEFDINTLLANKLIKEPENLRRKIEKEEAAKAAEEALKEMDLTPNNKNITKAKLDEIVRYANVAKVEENAKNPEQYAFCLKRYLITYAKALESTEKNHEKVVELVNQYVDDPDKFRAQNGRLINNIEKGVDLYINAGTDNAFKNKLEVSLRAEFEVEPQTEEEKELEQEIENYIDQSIILCDNYIKRLENDLSEIAISKTDSVKAALGALTNISKSSEEKLLDCATALSAINKDTFDQRRDSMKMNIVKAISTFGIGLMIFRYIKSCLGCSKTKGYEMIKDMDAKAQMLKGKQEALKAQLQEGRPADDGAAKQDVVPPITPYEP